MLENQFHNEPLTDFSQPASRQSMHSALQSVQSQLAASTTADRRKAIRTDRKIASVNPARPSEVVGWPPRRTHRRPCRRGSRCKGFRFLASRPAEKRAQYCSRLLASCGNASSSLRPGWFMKWARNWAEADGDVAEAIDFMEFYGREMLRYAQPQPLVPIRRAQRVALHSAGVGAVILHGISLRHYGRHDHRGHRYRKYRGAETLQRYAGDRGQVRGVDAGNRFAGRCTELYPGSGGEVGDTIVGHRLTRFIAFTGSKEVGLHINELASKTAPGQIWIKRVSRKWRQGRIVVDETADLEARCRYCRLRVRFQGQKCSACSRAVIVDSVYAPLVEKIVARTRR